jgi:uncharacterized protein YcaQ
LTITIDDLRHYAVARNFPKPTSLNRALQRVGFVQADPIRAPACAQDLTLRHRVKNYRSGDLERRYPTLNVEEDVLVNYGYVSKPLHALMHPRLDPRTKVARKLWGAGNVKTANLLLDFIAERGAVHPREVNEHFAHGRVTNYWGGSSNVTTQLLETMHYSGLLRVVKRVKGIRVYALQTQPPAPRTTVERRARIDALVDAVVRLYSPLPGSSLSYYVGRLRYAVPQWKSELPRALRRARQRLSHARIGSIDWYWPADEETLGHTTQNTVRFLAPFDPLVHDRTRIELLWNWVYRFEAYTPVSKRKFGYYAMPLLWQDQLIGWTNLSLTNGALKHEEGYIDSRASYDRTFTRELESELERMRSFLLLST